MTNFFCTFILKIFVAFKERIFFFIYAQTKLRPFYFERIYIYKNRYIDINHHRDNNKLTIWIIRIN